AGRACRRCHRLAGEAVRAGPPGAGGGDRARPCAREGGGTGSGMSSIASDPGGDSAGFDLSQFHQIFFEEAAENLEGLEQQLLALDLAAAEEETLNAIFRCAHSIKGGAATFGFADLAELTHEMESLLDRLRRRELAPTATMVDALLQATDILKAQLAQHQAPGTAEAIDTTALRQALRDLCEGNGQVPAAATVAQPVAVVEPAPVVEPPMASQPDAPPPAAAKTIAAADDFGFFDD